MTQQECDQFTARLADVQRVEANGYVLFFVGDDHLVPFASIAHADQEGDRESHLDRPGVFRVNIGVGKETFGRLVGPDPESPVDFTRLNGFLPHPHYAAYHFVCILNPTGENAERTRELIREAHALASARRERQRRVLSERGNPPS